MNWTWKIIEIDWENLLWMKIPGIPRIYFTFSSPSWDLSMKDYVHSYSLSWSVKPIIFILSIFFQLTGKILDTLFGYNNDNDTANYDHNETTKTIEMQQI